MNNTKKLYPLGIEEICVQVYCKIDLPVMLAEDITAFISSL